MNNLINIQPVNNYYLLAIFLLMLSCGQQESKKNENKKSDIIEIRVIPKNGINIRVGPGTQFEKDLSGTLIKGEKIYVINEEDNWLKFRTTLEDVGWHGWVRKDLTEPLAEKKETKSRSLQDDVAVLKNEGLLLSINPQFNEAMVDPVIWSALPFNTKKEIGRILAFYSGQQKGTNLNWVDIKDYYSGKKLAKYSEALGFDTY
jgi:hypothetical protein